jgi:threonine synthase
MNQFVCRGCGTTFALGEPRWRCDCGAPLDIKWASTFDLEMVARRKPTMWRYREAIPIAQDRRIVSFDEGFTPMVAVDFQGVPVWIKQDQLFSTGSYKDRGAAVLISKVVELGIKGVVEDSSGNAGCAIAAYCARAGIQCTIYVPENTSADKLAQIARYGAALRRVPGSREDTARAALEAAQNIYYASHSWNPFFFHGTKTFAFEVCEQLGWRAPDTVVLPVGNGTLLLGAAIGFRELRDAGVIERLPRLVGVQAEACAPLYQAWRKGLAQNPPIDKGDTFAEGIAIADPIRGPQIVLAVRESGGQFLTVSEGEIEAALREMCEQGFYIEPTSAAAVAGVHKHVQGTTSGEAIVSVFTGHGLKATAKMLKL